MKPPARELEILRAVAQGASFREIARSLGISEVAIRESLVRSRERYGTRNTEAAIALAIDREDIPPPRTRKRIDLTPDEINLLERIATGQQDKELMTALHLSRSNIDRQVTALLRKLGATNRCHAVYIGLTQGPVVLGVHTRMPRVGRISEADAIAAIAESTDLKEASESLGIEASSVKSYLQRSKRRLQARTTPHLVAIALRQGEILCPPPTRLVAQLLSQQERQALVLMATGLHDPEIAERMGMSTRNVGRIIPAAIRKIDAKSRSNAVLILFQQRILR
jgi:DNA-binding CsgD family transcriptional regulator